MFKTGILVLAAAASIGAALVASTASADARPGFHAGFKGGFHRPHFRPHFHRPHHHGRWHRPWIYGVGAAAVAAPAHTAVAPRPTAGPCTCLAKEYTPDKLVVFKDRCTKEVAAAPIGGPQQQGQAQPEPGDTEQMETK